MSVKGVIKKILNQIGNFTRPKIGVQVAALSENNYLKGRSALVTGGTSGIGFSIAESFLKSGASVVITGRNEEKLHNALQKLKVLGEIGYLVLDNTDVSSFEAKFCEATKILSSKRIDILVNNAGVNGGRIDTTTEHEYDVVLDTNLKGAFFMSKIVGAYMIKNNIKGNILNVASSSSLRPAIAAYTVSKWGLRGLTLGLAKAYAPYGITVNGVAPGQTATPMLHKNIEDDLSLSNSPIGRYALPEEIANMATILVSNIGKMCVGDIVYMTGGAGIISFEDVNYDLHF